MPSTMRSSCWYGELARTEKFLRRTGWSVSSGWFLIVEMRCLVVCMPVRTEIFWNASFSVVWWFCSYHVYICRPCLVLIQVVLYLWIWKGFNSVMLKITPILICGLNSLRSFGSFMLWLEAGWTCVSNIKQYLWYRNVWSVHRCQCRSEFYRYQSNVL